ncbi:MAG: heavy-metal-associated domain-containing protein [Actinomycetota bacterium]
MTSTLRVADATCGHCKTTIEGAVTKVGGVTEASLDLDSKLLRVEHADATGTDDLVSAIEAAGYTPEPVPAP